MTVNVRLASAVLALGLAAAAPGGDGRLAIEYGRWEKKSCGPAAATGSRGRTELPSAAPGGAAPQACTWCRPVRQCSRADRVNPARAVSCIKREECRTGYGGSAPPDGRGRGVG